jgi:hypothetical protein
MVAGAKTPGDGIRIHQVILGIVLYNKSYKRSIRHWNQ